MDDFTPLQGVYVPLVTPFAQDGNVAVDALERLAHSVLDDGVAGIVALGTTAEASALDDDERHAVLETCARVCSERNAALIVGAGSNNTRRSVAELAALGAWPATAALVTVPSFVRPSEEGVIAHFTRLAEETPVPLIIYNVPYRTGQTVGSETLRHLARLPQIAGVKHSVGGIDQDTVDLFPIQDFAVLVGDDAYYSPMLALGAQGGILATAQLCASKFVELTQAWQSADLSRARRLGQELAALAKAAFAEPNPTVIKGVLHAQGHIPTPDVRLPLLPASQQSVATTLKLL